MHALEERPILKHTSARHKFPQAAGICSPKFGADGQDRLGLYREIERIIRLVVVEAMHGVAVIEERRHSASAVREESLKSSIQAFRKRGIILIKMNEI